MKPAQKRSHRAGQLDSEIAVTNLDHLPLGQLRNAIQANQVSFPSQVPVFSKRARPDLQRKLVQLYFVQGWNCHQIAMRYELTRQWVQQILNAWKRSAIEMGYIQFIPPEGNALS